ncbi:MAG: hypothetical protein IKG25_06535 [Mogibacterium sp.]|nr:hypothetical protein [Mogibacterium sp.]MBQ6151370.1 hypothetical protein [Mogibacterium sp.]MBQ6500048.1 hypothetical protein [Mogibacterium sp.]MBR3330862.1 hypothetical protein [Mogibacterium sp.]MBR4090313.1 hypothetical protein [Mogibacterium sp.]
MKYLWNWIDRQDWTEKAKYTVIILLCAVIAGAVGLGVWSIVQIWALNHWSWMAVFTGYPAFISLVLIIVYSFNHDFHNGTHEKRTG